MAFISVSHDEFNCSVCLDLLTNPVTVPCGHSYCSGCITECWDQEDQKGVYSCPQCRETFATRPVLRRSTMLTDVVDKLRQTTLHCDNAANSEERLKKQRKLEEAQTDNQTQLQQRETELEDVQRSLHTFQASAQSAVEDAEMMFTELISFMEQKRSEVTEAIKAQERAEVIGAEKLVEQLEVDIAIRRSRDTEMQRLLQTTDDAAFLQNFDSIFPSLSSFLELLSGVTFSPCSTFKDVLPPVFKELEQRLQEVNPDHTAEAPEASASQSCDTAVSTAERDFLVGDRVRVKPSVEEPKHKWGSVTHQSVGVVKSFTPTGMMLVDFPGQSAWKADPSEMELQAFLVGDRVRVKASVKEPKHKWGEVTHSSVGVVKSFTPTGLMLVDFPGHSAWKADPSEMEYQGFMVGDRVRVKPSVKEPKHKWASVTHQSVGVVKSFTQNGLMLVDFPGETGWKADPNDMEQQGFMVGDRVRVKASVAEPKHKWGSVTHSSVGVVKSFTQNGLMLLDFPGDANWKADPLEMEYQGFMVGDRVRVKSSVKEPKHKWGSVTHSSVGVVKSFTPTGLMMVDFPGQTEWRADPSEMEYQGFMVGDRVRVKASVKQPKHKWGSVTHQSVGVVKSFTSNGTMLVDFPGSPEWKADPTEMDFQGFMVGDRVRVKASVQEPKHKWGSVTHSSVGVVKSFTPKGLMLVDFSGQSGWRADPAEMELDI
ncbi:uncharacterized protein LOC134461044 isoform X2 [Engraulis encrasicolus]|uniref:uncharacterized protein LOC134461044 isoform X2 n=1 Tax=Engraulis encrasicolus TaxID=184585 RepID=UPI002FD17632